jgi:hypothetical protein
MTRHNGMRAAAACLLLAGVIATGIGVAAPGVASAPVQIASQWAGPNVGHGTESSLSWAGYGVSGGTFTKVAGSWVQPRVTCPTKPPEDAAFWVGIDGLAKSDTTVEQIGTDSDCLAKSDPSYYAWYEMYPKKAVDLSPSKYPVVAGETIAAQVSATAKTFTLTISATSGDVVKWRDTIKPAVKTVPKESSAEWIVEAPCVGSGCTKVVPLSDFGSVNFSGLSVVGRATNPKAGFTDTEITMTTPNSASVKAYPSTLSSGGTAFGVTWVHN